MGAAETRRAAGPALRRGDPDRGAAPGRHRCDRRGRRHGVRARQAGGGRRVRHAAGGIAGVRRARGADCPGGGPARRSGGGRAGPGVGADPARGAGHLPGRGRPGVRHGADGRHDAPSGRAARPRPAHCPRDRRIHRPGGPELGHGVVRGDVGAHRDRPRRDPGPHRPGRRPRPELRHGVGLPAGVPAVRPLGGASPRPRRAARRPRGDAPARHRRPAAGDGARGRDAARGPRRRPAAPELPAQRQPVPARGEHPPGQPPAPGRRDVRGHPAPAVPGAADPSVEAP